MNRTPACVFLLVLSTFISARSQGTIRTVAMEGYPVPGEEDGAVFGALDLPVTNATGDIAFSGRIRMANGRQTDVVYRSINDEQTQAIAHAGQGTDPQTGLAFPWPEEIVPGLGGGPLFNSLKLNRHGDLAFGAVLGQDARLEVNGGHPEHSIWRADRNGSNQLVVRTSVQAPESPDGYVFVETLERSNPLRVIGIDDHSTVTFVGHLADSGAPFFSYGASRVETSIWQVAPSGAPTRIYPRVAEGTGAETALLYESDPTVSDAGGSTATIDRSVDANGTASYSLWRHDQEHGLSLVAASGGAAPGVDGITRFVTYEFKYWNGELTFPQITLKGGVLGFVGTYGQVTDPYGRPIANPDTEGDDPFLYLSGPTSGVWIDRNESEPDVVALQGQEAPGIGEGAVFRDYYGYNDNPFHWLSMNDSGQIAFTASYHSEGSPSDVYFARGTGVWSTAGEDGLQLIARAGDPSHSEYTGLVFGEFSDAKINAAGRVAFRANIGFGSGNVPQTLPYAGQSIWAQDSEGVLTYIVSEWQELDVDPDPLIEDLRTIRRLDPVSYNSSQEPASFQFNDRGEIVFWAEFTDGTSGVFVSSLVAIPEPVSVALATVILLGAAAQRR